MITVRRNDIETLKASNSLLQNTNTGVEEISFQDLLSDQLKESTKGETAEQASETIKNNTNNEAKKKSTRLNANEESLKLTQHAAGMINASDLRTANYLLTRLREEKKLKKENSSNKESSQSLEMINSLIAQGAALQQLHNNRGGNGGGGGSGTTSNFLSKWLMAPQVTEDPTKKAVRVDIPLVDDIQSVVLRLNSDSSVSAYLLGSHEMGELIKQNKEKLSRNLRNHALSLREFNTYSSPVDFDTEAGTKREKKNYKTAYDKLNIVGPIS